jgi:hypothetical protein
MSLRIENNSMSLEVDGRIVAPAQFSEHAVADDRGAWIVSNRLHRLFNRYHRAKPGNKPRSDQPRGYQGVSRS